MAFTSDHFAGFLFGLGASALGIYLYKKNQKEVDEFLRSQGINISSESSKAYDKMNLEELMLEKENLEDLIAEKEMAEAEKEAEPATEEG